MKESSTTANLINGLISAFIILIVNEERASAKARHQQCRAAQSIDSDACDACYGILR